MTTTDERLHIITSSDLDGLTVTTSPTALEALPASNMLDPRRGLFMRVTGTPDPLVITFTRGAGETSFYASGFSLARHNFPTDTTARLRLYEDINQTGTVVYDSGALVTSVTISWGSFLAGIDPWADAYTLGVPFIFTDWFDNVAYKSLQIDIDQPAGSEIAYLDIGRLYIGWAFVPTVNISEGVRITWVDTSIHNRTAGGGIRTENIQAYRRLEMDLNFLNNSDRERLSHLMERVGKGGDMLITLDPTATGRTGLENTMVGKRVIDNTIFNTGHDIHTSQLVFEES